MDSKTFLKFVEKNNIEKLTQLCLTSRDEFLSLLINSRDKYKATALYISVQYNHLDMINFILSNLSENERKSQLMHKSVSNETLILLILKDIFLSN